MDCIECRKAKTKKDCIECKQLIDGNYLAEKPRKKLEIRLEEINGEDFFKGQIELISPIGLALKSNVDPGEYKVKLLDDLELVISLVKSNGKPPYQGFDIISVFRGGKESNRLNKEDFEILSQSSEDIIDQLTEDLPSTTKNIIRERLKEEVEKSKLLDAFEVGDVLKYERGRLKSLSKNEISLPEEYLVEFMDNAFRDNQYKRDTIVDEKGEKAYDLHALPLGYKSGGMIAVDVTDVIKAEKENRERELQIYRDVIEAVTGGKLILINEKELEEELEREGNIIRRTVEEPKDIGKFREVIRAVLKKLNFNNQEESHIVLCVSEAITNALKHAGGGEVLIKIVENELNIIVKDYGNGIDFSDLPKATLMKDYSGSSSFSLGNGFTLMLRFIDRLLLKTDHKGTTLILEKEIS